MAVSPSAPFAAELALVGRLGGEVLGVRDGRLPEMVEEATQLDGTLVEAELLLAFRTRESPPAHGEAPLAVEFPCRTGTDSRRHSNLLVS